MREETIVVEGVGEGYPMSPLQKRLWQLQAGTAGQAFRARCAVLVEGGLDARLLERAVGDVIDRHEILRTTFRHRDRSSLPLQVVAAGGQPAWRRVDLLGLDPAEQRAQVEALWREEKGQPFDLRQPSLLRLSLLALSAQRHVLLVSLPALCADARTLDNLVEQISLSYAALAGSADAPGEAVQYVQFSQWQNELIDAETASEGEDYWGRRDLSALYALALPFEIETGAETEYAPERLAFDFDARVAGEVENVARRSRTSVSTVLHACWQTLLWRLTERPEIVVGNYYDGRSFEELRDALGLFSRWLPVQSRFYGHLRFEEILEQVDEAVSEAYDWQDHFLTNDRAEYHDGEFPAFGFEFAEQPGRHTGAGVAFTVERQEVSLERFKLKLTCRYAPDALHAEFQYDPAFYSQPAVSLLADYFQTLLTSIVSNPAETVQRLPLIGAKHRKQIVENWNGTATEYPRTACLHELFEQQAERTPDARALTFNQEHLSYAELNARANQLAHHLRASGVTPESTVALCLDRSPEMVVSLLAVLKAGGAYVPLDPSYPLERLRYMLDDASVSLILTTDALLDLLPAHWAQVVSLDSDAEAIAAQPETNPASGATADNLAYIMYTSGSTGQPKGVMVTHGNVVRLVRGQDYAHFDSEQVFAQLAPLSFDASTFEVWGSLLNGARLVVFAPGVPTLAEMQEVIEREGVTTLWLTAGLFHLLIDEGAEALSGVRQMLAGGDVVSATHARKFLEAAEARAAGAGEGGTGTVRMVNGYGPTESTTFACCHVMRGAEEIGRVVPIGRPIGNTQAYVLDGEMEFVPAGVTGELYLGGDGLARGYLNEAGLTAERFVPHPYAQGGGERLYRTGDLVRYDSEGQIEFVGRVDNQVKVRGFRIELGEIEAVLSQHPDVGENVVVAREELPGQKQLVAYLVGARGRVPALEDVRAFLRERLPEHMLPAAFVVLESLPLTAHGKVDRRALPAPDEASRIASDQAYVAPRTPIEEVIAGIWAGLLGMSQVGVHSNFFDLGGHSLLATQVIARVREALSVELSVRQLFESPTVAELSHIIESVLRDNSAGTVIPPLTLADRNVPFPLSFAQQRLWFLDQLEPGSAAYNIPAALRLTGTLDTSALERSLTEIVRRHEALRTTFRLVDSLPMQQIEASQPVPVPLVDLSHLPVTEREQQARQLAAEEAARPFDLSTGPLLRAGLIRLGAEEHIALLTMHHIISDGWSMGVLVREVGTLYEAYAAGQESPLEELAIQYADYAVWQREWLQGEVLEEQLGYWREQLQGAPAVLELPTDHPRPRVQSYGGAEQPFLLDPALSRRLKELSQQEGCTLFMTLLAAWQVLLSRYSGQRDISVGTPIAGRTHAETENLIGFFVNTLVLRSDLSGNPTFREVMKQVREVCLGAYAHQDVPFEKLVEELQPQREMSHSPLFQVMLILQNAPAEVLALSNLTASAMDEAGAAATAAKFDLTLALVETSEGLGGTLGYNTDLFEPATMERMVEHWQVLLTSIVAQPEAHIERLPLMTGAERQQLLEEWNATGRAYDQTHLLHELFEEQAARTPDAAAVIYDEEQLTYAELNARANQLAHHLQSLGVAPEATVGVFMERSIEMVVALMAVLKTGGAYLPLDPAYPAERLRFMVEDAAAPVILTQQHLHEHLPPSSAHIISLDGGESDTSHVALDEQPRTNLHTHVLPESPAYVIYTSGSTGQPKGVVVPHSGISNRLLWMQEAFRLDHTDVVLQKTPFSFDVSVWEFFWPLLAGAALAVARPGGHQDPHYLAQLIEERAVTTLHFVPSMLDAFLEEGNVGARCRGVRRVICSGEALGVETVRRFRAQLGEVELYNLYGPTEVSVDVTWWRCGGEEEEGLRSVPIGRPIANTQAYVLDGEMGLVPAGVTGELYLGGAGLARGYLARAGLTAERFVPHPYGVEAGERLYRTGDLARYRADGEIEFLGRMDHQVKVRGFRIELGEIEAVLRAHPAVSEAIVVAREDNRSDKRIIGYVVMGEAAVSTPELRQHLRERLPDYMVPQAFVYLDALPLTPNGKVDRKALPAPDESARVAQGHYVEPRNPTEEIVAGLWAGVLGLSRVGVEDNFFELGGHSLLATQVVARVREAFGVDVPLRTLFEQPTVRGLAAAVEAQQRAGTQAQSPPLVPVGRDRTLPLSFAQQRLWFLDQLEPNSAAYNIPTALRLTGALDTDALARSLSEIVRRHEALRTTFTIEDGAPVQVINPARPVELPLVDLSDMPAPEREARAQQLVAEEASKPFDLSAGPLLRAAVIRLSADEHIALLTMHHIISDGWSIGVLVKEVGALYAAYRTQQESPLAELPIQYADYAVWQREWLQGEVLDEQLGYWREQLQGAPAVLELPTDHPRPRVQSYVGAEHPFLLDGELLQQLKELSRQEGATLFMTLLAAWQVLLSRYSGQNDISVGTPLAGRTHAETEGLIGFFVNTLVLRADLSGNPTFREVLRQVREVCLGAYAHQDVPFEKLVEELQPQREMSHSPLFQVMLILQNAPAEVLALSDLQASGMEGDAGAAAKFDLTLALAETGEGLGGSLAYNTDLFERATMERMAGHLEVLLAGIVAQPEERIERLPLITGAEREQLLGEWNATGREYDATHLLHELFEEQAARTPDAAAVIYDEEQLTYAELNERANQLAHHLQSLGVAPEATVGVFMERSVEMVVALMSILKAGGAYLPLDPAYPQERLRFMVEDASAPVILTQRHLHEQLPPSSAHIISLDGGESDTSHVALDEQPRTNLHTHVLPESPAYVIYTSGSTGQPKGVVVPHSGISNRLLWMQEAFRLDHTDVVLQKTPFSFDVSVWEFFWPLLAGAALAVARPGGHQDPHYLAQLIEERAVTTLHFVPSMLDAFLEEGDVGARCRGVRRVICSGEALGVETVRRFRAQLGEVELYNLYGPTEVSVDVTWWRCGGEEEEGLRSVPIGRPIANTQAYVLDGEMGLVPAGVTGELYLGGAGLARGYLARAGLTAERFVPHPYGVEAGERLYRTGDLARYRADGEIEFLGRMDHQVKVRGFRIELGEIESALATHPSVREVAVITREDASGDKRLAAYVVADRAASVAAGELRAYLKERLPDYMLPSWFVFLEELPLSVNGKLDRRALPAPDESRTEMAADAAATLTSVEELVAGIYAEVLGLGEVRVDDDFFALGGHSLLATQVMSRLRKTFSLELPLRTLFEHSTVRRMATEVEAAMMAGLSLAVPPIVRTPRDGSAPLSFAQQRLWFIDQLEPGSTVYNIPTAVRLSGQLSLDALARTLSEVVRRHEALRTTFAVEEGEPVQVINPAYPVELPLIDLSHLPAQEGEERARQLVGEEASKPFDLSEGPLLRAAVIRLSAEDHIALLTMHHIISDGWSMGVLVREVGALYEAFAAEHESPLEELAIQYADYAVWQREWLRGEVLDEQLAYWREQLAGAPAVLELPTDHPRPKEQRHRGAHYGFAVDAEVARGLRELSRREGVTLFMTLLAAWQVLLARYSGQTDIVVGADVANRHRGETEGLIGFFVNMLVLRTDLSGAPTFSELLARVREVCLGAYAHQDMPFERLVEELQPGRDMSRSPLFQVLFVLQNTPVSELELTELTLHQTESSDVSAKFDLTLSMEEVGGSLGGTLGYDTDLFEEQTVARMVEHFLTLLAGVVSSPEQRIERLPLLTAPERLQVLENWNGTATEYPRAACLHELFEQQAERTPDARALTFNHEHLSYAELNARANRLAHHLRASGVTPESTVALCLDRSPEMVVSLLAILKAGGAYVPLDPSYPLERLRYMLDDASVSLILTTDALLDLLPAHWAQVVSLDGDAEAIAAQPETNPTSGATAQNLAYIMYTSGSTGQPKGVMVTHSNVVRLVRGQNYARFDSEQVFAQLAPLSFDASTFEVWGSLLNGARLVVFAPGVPTLAEMQEVIEGEGVTTLWLTAGLFHLLVDEGAEALSGVRQMLAGGDVVSATHARKFLEAATARAASNGGEVRMVNGYGPTESTTFACCHVMRGAEEVGRVVPIGRPIGNTQAYVLDGEMEFVPAGVTGELYLGGDGLARGYLNEAGLTAERFVPHPYAAQEGGERLYRTGDLVRYDAQGQIEFVGRVDNQVKVRGFRIELGEIEATVAQLGEVKEAVVIARGDDAGNKVLVCYLVMPEHDAQHINHVREYLKEKLPDYMVPQAFVQLPEMPLTANGKVDRGALPDPDQSKPELAASYVAPRNPTEETLSLMWAEVLKVERVGVEDDFFDLGGHSLLATQIISRVRETFKVEVPLRNLFESPTVAALAELLEKADTLLEPQAPEIVPVTRQARRVKRPRTGAQT